MMLIFNDFLFPFGKNASPNLLKVQTKLFHIYEKYMGPVGLGRQSVSEINIKIFSVYVNEMFVYI